MGTQDFVNELKRCDNHPNTVLRVMFLGHNLGGCQMGAKTFVKDWDYLTSTVDELRAENAQLRSIVNKLVTGASEAA